MCIQISRDKFSFFNLKEVLWTFIFIGNFFVDALHHFLLGSSLTITSLPGLVSLSLAFNSLRYACNCYHK